MDNNGFSSDEMQLVTFVLGQESFGVDIMNVQEIIRIPTITVIPQAPTYIEGITNLRGNILPIIDTRNRFGMDKIERDISSRVIVVDVRGNKVGLSVDAVSEVLRIESNRIEAAPEMVSGAEASSIAGVVKINNGKRLVMILEASRLCQIDQADRAPKANVKNSSELGNRVDAKAIEEVQLVSFLLGKEEFALEIEHVREIIRYPEIVKVPNMPDYIKGVISLRDTLMPIIDMRLKLGISDDTVTDSTRVIVVDVDDVRIGLVVDRVYEVARIVRDTIFPPPQALSSEAKDRLKGIARLNKGKRIILLLEPREIMTIEELQDIGSIESTSKEERKEGNEITNAIDEEQMVVFKLAEEQYGVRITQVQEINRLSKITKVPRAARFVEGVVNLRGDVIPVIDLRKRFEIESKEYTEFTRIIVSDINNKKIGLIVDEVMEVLRIPGKLVEEAPDIMKTNQAQTFMNGIANLGSRMIMMLNLENILVEKEWQRIADISKAEESPRKATTKLKKQGRED